MDKRRILILPKTEPWGFVKIADVKVNARVTGIQMYLPRPFPSHLPPPVLLLKPIFWRLWLTEDYRIRKGDLKKFDLKRGGRMPTVIASPHRSILGVSEESRQPMLSRMGV